MLLLSLSDSRDDTTATLAELYASHAPKVMRWATRLMGDANEGADVTQDVFLVVQRRLSQFARREASIEGWLFRITENLARNRRRRARWRSLILGTTPMDDSPADAPPPDDQLASRRSARVVANVLDALSASDRALLVLFELEGHSGDEVADLLGLSRSVIWVRLHRARARFAMKLEAMAPEEVR